MNEDAHDDLYEGRNGPRYVPRSEIAPGQLRTALRKLELLDDDMFLTAQASRLDMVD